MGDLPFVCVEEASGCFNIFKDRIPVDLNPGPGVIEGGWHVMNSDGEFSPVISAWRFNDLLQLYHTPVNTVLNYHCGSYYPRFSPEWNKATDTSFKCVAGKTGSKWVKCKTKRCSRHS